MSRLNEIFLLKFLIGVPNHHYVKFNLHWVRRKMKPSIAKSVLLLGLVASSSTACKTMVSTGGVDPTFLPFLRNSPNECYYLDDFMPVPDGLVTGKSGNLDLRYYSYKTANYKEWNTKAIMLSFYSRNGRCWSLFEEYYIAD
jgi:hypothetical protein